MVRTLLEKRALHKQGFFMDGKGWVCKERGKQYEVATMSRPDQWSELFWKKEP